MFWCMAKACTSLRIRVIHAQGLAVTSTSGVSKEDWSGAVTAVALGFDSWLTRGLTDELPASLRHCKTLREVIETSEGAAWWKAEPRALKLFFDTAHDSKCMQVLGAYIRSRKIRISQ